MNKGNYVKEANEQKFSKIDEFIWSEENNLEKL